MVAVTNIDILESVLRRKGDLLDTLLIDRTTKKNIIWGTDSYLARGKEFEPKKQVTQNLVTGIYLKLIQPRAAKPLAEQRQRTKDKAEVFTPKEIVGKMNRIIDWSSPNWPTTDETWRTYVQEARLEIACGEAPFIISRYNPTAHTGKVIELKNRVGFLDRKLKVVSEYCHDKKEWLFWAKEAYKASYGYEWQGDNLLIARENLLYSMIDYYKDKFQTDRSPSLAVQREFAEIISWNIFQMDGLKYVIPMSCHPEKSVIPEKLSLFGDIQDSLTLESACEGCYKGHPLKHNGRYARIMDWSTNKQIRFIDIIQ